MGRDPALPALPEDPEVEAFRATRRALEVDLNDLRAELAEATQELAVFAEQLRKGIHRG